MTHQLPLGPDAASPAGASGPRDGAERLARAHWHARVEALLGAFVGVPLALAETDELGSELGLDSLAFEALFAGLQAELPGKVPLLAWFNQLEARGASLGVLLDLIEAHLHASAAAACPPSTT